MVYGPGIFHSHFTRHGRNPTEPSTNFKQNEPNYGLTPFTSGVIIDSVQLYSGHIISTTLTCSGILSADGGKITSDGSGGLTVGEKLVDNGSFSCDGAQIYSDGSGNLTMDNVVCGSIQNSGQFYSDAGTFTSDGSGNVAVQTLTSAGIISGDSLSVGPSTFGTISSDSGSIHSDGSGDLYATTFLGSFSGNAGGATNTYSSGIATTLDLPIHATGVTNTGTRFCTAVLTASAATFWITNQFGVAVGTNATFTGTIALPLAPSAVIHAASGLSGYCYY